MGWADNPDVTDARPTVLLIDDDADFTELLAAIIENAGCKAVVANNGFCGLRLAREVCPSLILCDVAMPGLDGEKVFRLLQGDALMANVPRVLMSGYGCPDLTVVPADAFIAKPINTQSLRRLLRAFTRSTAAGAQSVSSEEQATTEVGVNRLRNR